MIYTAGVSSRLAVLADCRVKVKVKEGESLGKYLGFSREKIQRNMKVTVNSSVAGALGTVLNKLEKRFDGLKIRGRIRRIQSIEQPKPNLSFRDLRTFALTQISVKNHQYDMV